MGPLAELIWQQELTHGVLDDPQALCAAGRRSGVSRQARRGLDIVAQRIADDPKIRASVRRISEEKDV